MHATTQPVGSTPRLTAAYRELMTRGFEPREAANVTAVLAGLRIGPEPWTVNALSHLFFLRALREDSRFGPDDGAR